MIRPSKIKVNHLEVPIKLCSGEQAETEGYHGWFDPRKVEICMQEDLSPMFFREILLHEVLHAIFHAYRLAGDMSGSPQKKKYTEEDIVLRLAPAIMAFIKDNPDFIRWLKGSR